MSPDLSKKLRKAEKNAAKAEKMAHHLHLAADAAHHRAEDVHAGISEVRKKGAKDGKFASSGKGGVRAGRHSAKQRPVVEPGLAETESVSALPFNVVGIGASAGGYEAISHFLAALPPKTGMAYVVVPHLDPHRESKLTELLAKVSRIPVVQIRNGMVIEPDKFYVLPSNATVTMAGNRLKLTARGPEPVPMPIDVFFRSLAREQETRAIGILLSGMGTDGSLGVEEIKGQGGITFAQDKGSAKYYVMPASAAEAGAIDFVLPPEGIAQELGRLAQHPYVARESQIRKQATEAATSAESLFKSSPEELRELFTLLRVRTGVDFSLYKAGTLNRRIMRRMVLRRQDALGGYIRLLQETPAEVEALFHDLLISVTGFFRDPAIFRALQSRILPKLLRDRESDAPLRLWSCGCATGEEAYSLAIIVTEAMEKMKRPVQVQIFASDLNERGVQKARAGIYQENILQDVSQERLRRFFVKVNGHYQVHKQIRDMCVFARQNVATEPPFSNLDLISCRNVLIYLAPALQRRILPVFHYALKPGGYLLLGTSETIGEHSELFELTDKKNKIYTKKTAAYRPMMDFEGHYTGGSQTAQAPVAVREQRPIESDAANLLQKVDRILLAQFSPAGVVINSQMDALQFRGKTGAFFEHQQGAASLNLLKIVQEDLALDVRRAVTKAVQTGERVEHSVSELRMNGGKRQIRIEVLPLTGTPGSDGERFFLVLFHEAPPSGNHQLPRLKKTEQRKMDARQIFRLKDELAATKESLQAIIEEQEATNEELKSANEEIQSSNEELQSTNEELETAREELQSTNEELTTLNQELQSRNSELGQLNNDLTNLLSSVHIAVIMLGTDFKIRRYTPMAEKIFNLIPSDVGRRLGDLNRNVNIPDLDDLIKHVIDELAVVEREVQDRDGRWYSLRIRPYRTQESVIDGVVLMLLDVDELKRSIRQIVATIPYPLVLLHGDLRVNRANEAFCSTFGVQEAELENRPIYEAGQGLWDFPDFRNLIEEVLPRQGEVQEFRLEHDFPRIGPKKLLVNARRFYEESRGVQFILLAMEELTE